jgi:DNA polymerase-4
MARVILHIDMNSYFATVEQQSNPKLLGKPIAVSGRPSIHSVVATASYEAKKYGVRAGMNTIEAKRLCPGLIFIPGDPNKYIDVTGRLIKIFKSFSPHIEIFSIDEVFMELYDRDPIQTAMEIKQKIKNEIGKHMTCSIGISSNKFLAKLASEKQKPDGLVVINENNLDNMLLTSKLEDFCGIGRRILKRLNDFGINSVSDLRNTSKEILIYSFGNVCGTHLHNMAYGVDHSPLVPDFEAEEAKSFSHALTLHKATDNRKYIEAIMLRLSERVARRMRADGFSGRVVNLYVRFPDMGGISEQKLVPHYINDGAEIFETTKELFPKDMPTIRMLSVGITYLRKTNMLTNSLLPEDQKIEKIVSSMDLVNNKFGENSVFRAAVLPAFEREKNVAGIRTKLRFN